MSTQQADATISGQRTVPATALRPVDDPAAWTKESLGARSDWIYPLTDAEIADLDKAVAALDERGLDIIDIRRADVTLPVLSSRLALIKDQILNGLGLALIRGVPVQRYTRRQSAIAFWCIGLYVGVPVSQNAKGHVLGHVQDLVGATNLNNHKHRGYHTRATLPYHCDSCDVVGLLCLNPSKSGGESTVTSSLTIYNEMLKRRPDLAAELAGPIWRDRRDEVPEGKKPYFQLPVFNRHDGYLTVSWQGGYIKSSERFAELPRRSAALNEALEMFEDMADELAFSMDFRPGDIQFLHNHVTVHSRTEFEDWPEPERKRHLLRLWLATPDGRPLAPAYRDRYAHLGPDDRPAGGIMVPGTRLKAPLEAE